jgi:hypothetical protein
MTTTRKRKKAKAVRRKAARKSAAKKASAGKASEKKTQAKKAPKARAAKSARRRKAVAAKVTPAKRDPSKDATPRKAVKPSARPPLASHVLSGRRMKAVARRGPARARVSPRRTHPAKRVAAPPRIPGVVVKGAMRPRYGEVLTPAALRFLVDLHRAFEGRANELAAGVEESARSVNPNDAEGPARVADFAAANMATFANRIAAHLDLKDRATGAPAIVRPRGWQVAEASVIVDGQPIAAALFDFGLCLFHGAAAPPGARFHLPELEEPERAQLWNAVFAFALERLDIASGTIRASAKLDELLP